MISMNYQEAKELAPLYEQRFKEVWTTLSAINVNDHTETKGDRPPLTYLSWAWAYITMMNHYPTFEYAFGPLEIHKDETVTVHVQCKIVLDAIELTRTMWLPVMNNVNKPVNNPSSTAINTAKMRCLTKCMGMFGLGAYIYAGEDLPQEIEAETQEEAKPVTLTKKAVKVLKPLVTEAAEKKVTSIKKKALRSEMKPVEDDFYCEDEDAAEEYAQFMINTATDMHSGSMEALVEFWQLNTNASNYLKDNYPDQYVKVRNAFTELKSQLTGE